MKLEPKLKNRYATNKKKRSACFLRILIRFKELVISPEDKKCITNDN